MKWNLKSTLLIEVLKILVALLLAWFAARDILPGYHSGTTGVDLRLSEHFVVSDHSILFVICYLLFQFVLSFMHLSYAKPVYRLSYSLFLLITALFSFTLLAGIFMTNDVLKIEKGVINMGKISFILYCGFLLFFVFVAFFGISVKFGRQIKARS